MRMPRRDCSSLQNSNNIFYFQLDGHVKQQKTMADRNSVKKHLFHPSFTAVIAEEGCIDTNAN